MLGGTPTTITIEYYAEHWNGDTVGPSGFYTPHHRQVSKDLTNGQIVQYLSLDDGTRPLLGPLQNWEVEHILI